MPTPPLYKRTIVLQAIRSKPGKPPVFQTVSLIRSLHRAIRVLAQLSSRWHPELVSVFSKSFAAIVVHKIILQVEVHVTRASGSTLAAAYRSTLDAGVRYTLHSPGDDVRNVLSLCIVILHLLLVFADIVLADVRRC